MATELEKFKADGWLLPRVTQLRGTIVIGAAGAIATQTGQQFCGVVFAKNASTGRYDGTLHRGYRRTISGDADMIGPTAGTAPNAAKTAYVTGVSSANLAGTAPISGFSVLTLAADGATATNPTSGDIISWSLDVSDL
jgi:hypothetical protein